MADYKHEGFDTYGYVEEIHFTPLSEECNITYTKELDIPKNFNLVDSIVSQDFDEQTNLTLPQCKCLRK